jgi:hypothetical protein
MRARVWICGVALALISACGGKTGEGDGNSAGSGGGGVGGSGVGGSSVGGSGVGGAAAGGSSGGGAAGTAGSGGGPIAELIGVVCDQIEQLSCALPGCQGQLYDAWGDAFEQGCEQHFEEALRCLAEQPLTCAGGQLMLPAACGAIVDALESCMDVSSSCGGGIGNGTCSIQCDGWGATCSEHMGSLSCHCTLGPNAGTTFTLPGSCSSMSLEHAEYWCG